MVRQSSKTTADICLCCKAVVSNDDHALLCDLCGSWEHLKCNRLPEAYYKVMQSQPNEQILFCCQSCKAKRRRARCSLKRTSSLPPTRIPDVLHPTTSAVTSVSRTPQLPVGAVTPPRTRKRRERVSNPSSSSPDDTPLPDPVVAAKPIMVAPATPEDTYTIDESSPPSDVHSWRSVPDRSARRMTAPVTPPRAPNNQPPAPAPANTRSEITVARSSVGNRDKSVILFSVPEATAESSKERLDSDCAQVQDILRNLLSPGDDPITVAQIYRLGARPITGAPRPLKLVLQAPAAAQWLLSRSYRLRGLPYSLRPDLSPEDRAKRRNAVNELRERTQNGEKDLIIVNFRVVQRRNLLRQSLVISVPVTAIQAVSQPQSLRL